MSKRERTPDEIMDQIIREQLNPECSVTGRLDRLERQIIEIFERLGNLEDAE